MSFGAGFSPLLWILVVVLLIFWKSMATEWGSRYNTVIIATVLIVVIVINSVTHFSMVSGSIVLQYIDDESVYFHFSGK